MSRARRPIGKQSGNAPVVAALAYLMMGAPMVIAAMFGWQSLGKGPSPVRAASAPAMARAAGEKPVLTTAVLRPSRESSAATPREKTTTQATSAPVSAALPEPGTAAVARSEIPAGELTTASTPAPRRPSALARTTAWRMETLRNVGVAAGLKLISDGAMLRLAGVEPLGEEATCKRLDGVLEPCAIRAASRMEVLTRGRTITCRVFEQADGEPPAARCSADKIDIADDLVKNGLARRAAI